MRLTTASEMQEMDRQTIESCGIPGKVLMENAGCGAAAVLLQHFSDLKSRRIGIAAGRGNNGGDGFRVAELLVRNGFDTEVCLIGKKTDVSGDAATCMNDAEAGGMKVAEITDESDIDKLSEKLMFAGIIVDAMFGTGLKGEVTGLPAMIIDRVNSSEAEVIAVDIPSGVNASTGEESEHTVQADYTITFGCLKVGHVVMPGRLSCGDVNVVNIGFSPEVIDSVTPFANTLSTVEAAQHIPCRAYNAHKGSTGRVFVIAGSVGMTGAAALVSRAAMLAGAGVVTVGCPRSLNDVLEIKLTEVMTFPLPEVRKKRCLSMRALGLLRKQVQKADVVAIGPGLGTYYETKELVRRFISEYNGRIVLDADGINAFEGDMESLRSAPCEIVITPHAGELAKLTGISIGDIIADPFKASQKASEATGKIVLLKGSPTVISDPSGTIWINSTGNEGMATAGMGDVLTGTISGLAAQELDLYYAAILGAYVHGLAGEIVSEKKGIHSVMAVDVLESLPDALLEILNENNTMKKSGEYVEN